MPELSDARKGRAITLREAVQIATDALLRAEQQRRDEREREAAYWDKLERGE